MSCANADLRSLRQAKTARGEARAIGPIGGSRRRRFGCSSSSCGTPGAHPGRHEIFTGVLGYDFGRHVERRSTVYVGLPAARKLGAGDGEPRLPATTGGAAWATCFVKENGIS